MRIVISTKRYRPILGGSIQYVAMLAKAFREAGHEVRIMTRTPGPDDEEGLLRNPGIREMMDLAAWADVLLQVDASWRDVWPFLLRRVPWFPTLHFGYPTGPKPLRARLELLALKAAFILGRPISVGHEVARSWGLQGTIIPNPYDDSVFRSPAPDSARDIDLLFVGRIERSKGVFVLLEVLGRLAPKLARPIRCTYIGSGIDGEELTTAVAGFPGDRVHFDLVGSCPPSEVAAWMQRSRCLVFPTTPAWIEASPLTPLEALACGCRVIAADSGGTRENIGPQGTLIVSGSTDELLQALRRELTAPIPVDQHAVGKFLSARRLTPIAAQYLEHFQQAINKQ